MTQEQQQQKIAFVQMVDAMAYFKTNMGDLLDLSQAEKNFLDESFNKLDEEIKRIVVAELPNLVDVFDFAVPIQINENEIPLLPMDFDLFEPNGNDTDLPDINLNPRR